MTLPRVDIETTIPSFYHEARETPDHVARREWTRRWWHMAVGSYELVTSVAVLDELGDGPSEYGAAWLDLVRDLPPSSAISAGSIRCSACSCRPW